MPTFCPSLQVLFCIKQTSFHQKKPSFCPFFRVLFCVKQTLFHQKNAYLLSLLTSTFLHQADVVPSKKSLAFAPSFEYFFASSRRCSIIKTPSLCPFFRVLFCVKQTFFEAKLLDCQSERLILESRSSNFFWIDKTISLWALRMSFPSKKQASN